MHGFDDSALTYDDTAFLYSGWGVGERPDATHHLKLYAFGSNFSVGNQLADISTGLNILYGKYINDVDELAFTLTQDDALISTMASYIDKAWVRLYRGYELIWEGLLMDSDEMEDDVIFYAFSRTALLAMQLSGFNEDYSGQTIGQIVKSLFDAAKAATNSLLQGVIRGQIQDPVTTSGGSTAYEMNEYKLYKKPLLHAFQELATLAMGNTTNLVRFEITHSEQPIFQFWKNRSTTVTRTTFELGDGKVTGFRLHRRGSSRRNKLYGYGYTPTDVLLQDTEEDSSSQTTYGLREAAMLFDWVRDGGELSRVMLRRLGMATRTDWDVMLNLAPDSMAPPTSELSDMDLGDLVHVKIERGMTSIDGTMRLVGVMVYVVNGVEQVKPLLQEVVGS